MLSDFKPLKSVSTLSQSLCLDSPTPRVFSCSRPSFQLISSTVSRFLPYSYLSENFELDG